MSPSSLFLALLFPLLPACATTLESSTLRTLDPVVVIHSQGGEELGVSTDYGVVFLGQTVQSGRIEFTAWFADGPSREEGLVEPMGAGLFATASEILLPSVGVCFDLPPEGTELIVRGRRGDVPFEIVTELASHPNVTGVLLKPNVKLDALTDADRGAGVFYVVPGTPPQLVGLLSGRLEFEGGRRFVTAVGPESLWRVVVHRRNSERPRHQVYREDIL